MFGTNWTSACEIFRDLSVAQGDVPVRVEGALGAGDKPPALYVKEETEEQYILCSGGDDLEEGPDLGLIQEMLNMVRGSNLSDDETPQESIVITKPNPTPPPVTVPIPAIPDVTKSKVKKQKRRNIALESFIGVDVTPKIDMKLLKPDDLITKPKIVEPDLTTVEASIDKVKGWLLSNGGNRKPAVFLEPPTNMFRKKEKAIRPIESPEGNLSVSKSPSRSQSKEFIPSAYAIEYCNKLKERAKLKENIREDIWTKAQKQMKMLDKQREAKAEQAAIEALVNRDTDAVATTDLTPTPQSEETNTTTTSTDEQHPKNPWDLQEKFELPEHRHLLTDECVVCQAFKEFGYSGFSDNM